MRQIRRSELVIALAILVGASAFFWFMATRKQIEPPEIMEYVPSRVHGIGVPIQDTDPDTWPYQDIPFLTWNSAYCHRDNFFPIKWRREPVQANCEDGRVLLLINEPEYKGQANLSPSEAADIVREYQDWDGEIFCCGNAWFSDGWKWMEDFILAIGDDIDIIDGLHIHTYSNAQFPEYYDDYADNWSGLAREHNWTIIISEWGITNATDEDRDWFVSFLTDKFNPRNMFIFSWRYHLIPSLDLVDASNDFTEIGRWWFSRWGGPPNQETYLPFVSK